MSNDTRSKPGRIRAFNYSDLERVFEIEFSAFPNERDERFGLYDFHSYHKNYRKNFVVYESCDNGRVLGYAIFTPRGHIVSLVVDPLHRGNGIGRALLSEALKYAKKRLWLEVSKNNEQAIRFYKTLGFREKRSISGYYSSGEDAIVMELLV